jgi:hypothetical protein
MRGTDNLIRRVPAGEIIKPWLIWGPLYQDLSAYVQGLTLFERKGASVGQAALAEVVEEAEDMLSSFPHEGQEVSWRGTPFRWILVRRPEEYLSWGTYHISNHLAASFLSSIIVPNRPGPKTWRLVTRITSRIQVAIQGRVVFDSHARPTDVVDGSFVYSFDAELEHGENTLTVAMYRLGRMARVGCRLEIVDGDVQASVRLSPGMSLDRRAGIERELGGLRLLQDVFYPEDTVGIALSEAPSSESVFRTQLLTRSGEVLHEITPSDSGPVCFCRGEDLADGSYQIVSSWYDASSQTERASSPVTAVAYDVQKLAPVPAPQGYDRREERRRLVLEHYARNDESRPIWTQVARYALARQGLAGPPVDETVICDTCAFIAARKDCADFVIQGILRMMYWERERQLLSDGLNALMKDTVLGFKYWVDEPGDTVMYMGSENHRLLFHVAEWMAGQLFPNEEFTNSRQRGLYHATKGRTYITEWLRQRGRFGFDEWHSNSYYPISIAPIVNVYDFAIYEDYKLRQMAGAVLDYAMFNQAADSIRGVFGTTHGRSYGRYVKYPDLEGTAATCWLLYGTGSLVKGTSGMAPVTLATSRYDAPKILSDIATDDQAVIESRVRQGILRGVTRHANFCVYRTPDYLVSGLQDHRKGEYESSTHVAQVTLVAPRPSKRKAVLFWSCPHTSGEGSGLRPDYWSGHTTLPRVVQYRNVMSLTWQLSKYAWMTHCFFETARFDQVRMEGKWAFACLGRAYVGIYSENGLVLAGHGPYAGRELVCEAAENTWLVECGREADWGSFEAFVDALLAAQVTQTGDGLSYSSPSVGRFATGWQVTPTIDGVPIPLRRYPLVESPWASSRFGSGELTIRYGDEIYELWLNQ